MPIRDGEQWGVAKIKARLWTPPDSTAILTICHIVARRADLAGHNPKLGSECFCGKRGISFYPGRATVRRQCAISIGMFTPLNSTR